MYIVNHKEYAEIHILLTQINHQIVLPSIQSLMQYSPSSFDRPTLQRKHISMQLHLEEMHNLPASGVLVFIVHPFLENKQRAQSDRLLSAHAQRTPICPSYDAIGNSALDGTRAESKYNFRKSFELKPQTGEDVSRVVAKVSKDNNY